MPRLERLLCPVDLSDASRRALDYALALARQHDASLRVLQVVDFHGWAGGQIEGLDAIAASSVAALEEQLGWWVARSLNADAGAATEVREGAVVPGILATATEMNADLIVVGTHGRSGFERFALGSVAEKVVRRAACPVLVVPSREDAIVRTGQLTRVVVATDFSEAAAGVASYGHFFTTAVPSALSLMTVIDWPFGETHGKDPVTQLRQNLEQEASDQLRRVASAEGLDDEPTYVVRCGKAGREILQYARDARAELIVIGVSGRGALDRALLGSTAHQVLRDAPCPVLTVPASVRP